LEWEEKIPQPLWMKQHPIQLWQQIGLVLGQSLKWQAKTCIATDYILVHKEVKDKLVAALKTEHYKCYGEINIESIT